jgi:hypothetical protein
LSSVGGFLNAGSCIHTVAIQIPVSGHGDIAQVNAKA